MDDARNKKNIVEESKCNSSLPKTIFNEDVHFLQPKEEEIETRRTAKIKTLYT